jgi:hypothetical protein
VPLAAREAPLAVEQVNGNGTTLADCDPCAFSGGDDVLAKTTAVAAASQGERAGGVGHEDSSLKVDDAANAPLWPSSRLWQSWATQFTLR